MCANCKLKKLRDTIGNLSELVLARAVAAMVTTVLLNKDKFNPAAAAYHDESPVSVDDLAFSQGRPVEVDDPEESDESRTCSDLAAQVNVAIVQVGARLGARDLRPVCACATAHV